MCVQQKLLTMNRLFRLLTSLFAIAFIAVGCEQEGENGAVPTIKIEAGEVTATTISFKVTATGAKECAYFLYDGNDLTAERVLTEGTAIKGDGTATTVEGLQPETTYIVVAAARNDYGAKLSSVVSMKTSKEGSSPEKPNEPDEPGKPDEPSDPGYNPDPDARQVEIASTQGNWYDINNYYVTLTTTQQERIILDIYTIMDTMGSYLPYGNYSVRDSVDAWSVCSQSSGIILHPEDEATDGFLFTDGVVSVDLNNGAYALYFHLTYVADGTTNTIEGYYNGPLSGATVPEGDNEGATKLIEVHEVGSTSFKFTIHAEAGQYWRCSVVDKRVYDQYQSNPGAWVVTHGFMLDGTRTFNWEDGKECEHVPGLKMSVTSSTDYLIFAALMDYSEGKENVLLGGVEVAQIRTEAQEAGTATVDIDIKEINANDILFDCTFGDDVWCCYVAMMETANLQEIKDGKYAMGVYSSYEECMLSLIPGLSYDYMRQFIKPQVDYRWEYLKYGTSYTICVKVEDMDKRVSYIELKPFTTK